MESFPQKTAIELGLVLKWHLYLKRCDMLSRNLTGQVKVDERYTALWIRLGLLCHLAEKVKSLQGSEERNSLR